MPIVSSHSKESSIVLKWSHVSIAVTPNIEFKLDKKKHTLTIRLQGSSIIRSNYKSLLMDLE